MYEENDVEIAEQSSLEMNLSHLPEGVYFIFISNDDLTTSKKFVVNH
jgi:hypothetical protein